MHQWQNVDAQSVPMQRLYEQFINQIQQLTFKILSIPSQDILYAYPERLSLGWEETFQVAQLYNNFKMIILDNFMWAIIFGTPSRNMGSEVQIS